MYYKGKENYSNSVYKSKETLDEQNSRIKGLTYFLGGGVSGFILVPIISKILNKRYNPIYSLFGMIVGMVIGIILGLIEMAK